MSTMGIDQVLAQIRSISAQTIGSAPGALQPQAPLSSAGVNSGTNAVGFADLLKQGIDAVNSNQQSADALASAWERGAPGVDLARVMVESQKASVSFEALAQVRNRLVSVYQDIMNMQI